MQGLLRGREVCVHAIFGWGPQLQLQLQMDFGDLDTEGDLIDGSDGQQLRLGQDCTSRHSTAQQRKAMR
jgi:hypothetical protein